MIEKIQNIWIEKCGSPIWRNNNFNACKKIHSAVLNGQSKVNTSPKGSEKLDKMIIVRFITSPNYHFGGICFLGGIGGRNAPGLAGTLPGGIGSGGAFGTAGNSHGNIGFRFEF